MKLIHILTTATNAVLPIVLLILLGYWLRQKKLLSESFLKNGNWLVFHVCLPCMMFINAYDIEGFDVIPWDVVLYSMAVVPVLFLSGTVLAIGITKDPRKRGPLAQAAFRSNVGIIGLVLAEALGGGKAVAVAAVISAFNVVSFNILGVLSLTMFLSDNRGKLDLRKIGKSIVRNPLIIGIVLGMGCLALRELQTVLFGEPVFLMRRELKFLYTAVNNLKNVTSPLALIIMGGQFTFTAVKALRREIVSGTFVRLILAPALGIGGAIVLTGMGILNCGTYDYPALIALYGSPVAVASGVMAAEMGSDEQLATQLVVWTSIGSIATIFLTVCLLMAGGLLMI